MILSLLSNYFPSIISHDYYYYYYYYQTIVPYHQYINKSLLFIYFDLSNYYSYA